MIWTVLGTLGIVAVTIVAGVLADRRWTLLPRKEDFQLAAGPRPLLPGHGEGEAPQTAIAASPGDVELLRRKQRCPRCKIALDSAAEESVAYDGSALRVLRFTCARCAGVRSIYVRTP